MSECDKGLDSMLYYDSEDDGIEIIWINICCILETASGCDVEQL